MPSAPTVSVVMPVHNALPHLDEAVRSILDQSFADFEFVIYDDGSSDGSVERLREWTKQDRRIRLFEGKRNLGPVGSSAFAVEHSTAPLVARMDADDRCSPDRLQRQLDLMREHPECGLVGTLFEVIDDAGRVIRGPEIWRLQRRTPFVPFGHGSMLFRRDVFDRVDGYRQDTEYWEDQDLVVRMAAVADVLVIPSALYQVRQWAKNTRATSDRERVEDAVDLMYRSIGQLTTGRSYDDLLQADTIPARVDPRVFISLGSVVLWSGERPHFFWRLLQRGRLRPDFGTLSTFVWTAWASLSPASLRAFMKLLLRARNVLAKRKVSTAEPFRWSPRPLRSQSSADPKK